MEIPLRRVLQIDNLANYKVHLASWDRENQPLDVFVRDYNEWEGWNRWRSNKDDFNREKIFSLIDFYPESGIWLFGGIFTILSRTGISGPDSYRIACDETSRELVGRLKIRLKRPARGRSFLLEKTFDQMVVSEILRERYSGERFPGYENIHIRFTLLEQIISSERPDWKTALANVKGVYVITDSNNGKKYVGSAYGDNGKIWSRWSCYVRTGGHGWNDELTKLISVEGIEYARKFFHISLLEYRSAKTDDREIIARESFWKATLMSRGEFGYNKN